MFSFSLLQLFPLQTIARRACTEGKTVEDNIIIPGGTDKQGLSVIPRDMFSVQHGQGSLVRATSASLVLGGTDKQGLSVPLHALFTFPTATR
jgi:hypothetical protein